MTNLEIFEATREAAAKVMEDHYWDSIAGDATMTAHVLSLTRIIRSMPPPPAVGGCTQVIEAHAGKVEGMSERAVFEATREAAAKAVCWRCRVGEERTLVAGGEWFHQRPDCRINCPARKIWELSHPTVSDGAEQNAGEQAGRRAEPNERATASQDSIPDTEPVSPAPFPQAVGTGTPVSMLREYPNLQAILIGTVSGRWTEWPAIRSELRRLTERLALCDIALSALQGAGEMPEEPSLDDVTKAPVDGEWVAYSRALRAHALFLADRVAEMKGENERLLARLNHAVSELAHTAMTDDYDAQACLDAVERIEGDFAKIGKTTDSHMLATWYGRLCAACGVDDGDEIDILPLVEKELARLRASAQRVEWPEEPSEAVQEAARDVSAGYPYKPAQDGKRLGYLQVGLLYKAMRSAHVAEQQKKGG